MLPVGVKDQCYAGQ